MPANLSLHNSSHSSYLVRLLRISFPMFGKESWGLLTMAASAIDALVPVTVLASQINPHAL